jgi:hypothetical protein
LNKGANMKKFLMIGLLVVLFGALTGCSAGFYTTQKTFSSTALRVLSPDGLEYGKEIGKNWWEGTFRGKPVLIHGEVTSAYVNVDITFLPESLNESE